LVDFSTLKGEQVDKQIAIQAIRAAFAAEQEHPVTGTEHIGPRTRQEIPMEGEIDFAYAQETQRAAQEVIAADSSARARDQQVEDRIAEVYKEDSD